MLIKILVVDDSASDRLIIKNMLSEYSILTACDGVEAMHALEEHGEINLLILDLNMPNMNGFQVLEYLKDNERFKKMCTIILTNHDELDNEIKGLKLGAVDYIRKPIHMNSLKARIDVHVSLLRAQQALEQQFDEQTITFDMIFDQAPIGIALSYNIDPYNINSNTITSINPMFEQITGRTQEDLINLGWAKITHIDDLDEDIDNFRKLQAGEIKNYSMEKRYEKPDGSFVWVYMIVAALAPIGNGFNHICLIQDISDRKQIENKLKYINEHDRWTGLYNREYLEIILENDAKKHSTIERAIVGVNLSTIQLLTANYGFHYTQNIIKKVAETLGQYSSEKCILFKTYENRFVFYLKDYNDKKDLIDFAEAIADILKSLFVTDRIGGGIGVLEIEQGEKEVNVDLLLRRLLIASERAITVFDKDFGTCFYNEELEALVNREIDIRQALSAVVADDVSDELFLQYQPIMELKTESICGFEALARLRTQKIGLVSPIDFIPIAEKTKLIIPLGEKIIFKAFCFLNRLKEYGFETIGVSINISAIQLLRPDFTSWVIEMIREMQVNPKKISLEITEWSLLPIMKT